MRPPGSVYLAALFSRFTTTCSRRVGIRIEAHGLLGESNRELVLPLVHEVADARDRSGNDRPELQRLQANLDLAQRDSGDIEQVVDQAGEVLDLSIDDLPGPRDLIRVDILPERITARRC